MTDHDSYVDEYKVVSSTNTTVTLENGVVVNKDDCRFASLDTVAGKTYYRFEEEVVEKINHPEHYGGDTLYEAIKVIEAWKLGFNLGNAVKYISRAGKKGDALLDLRKALWYLQREIDKLSKENP